MYITRTHKNDTKAQNLKEEILYVKNTLEQNTHTYTEP